LPNPLSLRSKISISYKHIAFFIAILGTLWAYLIHIDNIRYLKQSKKATNNNMVLTADDASYISPAENYRLTGVWKDNTEGVSSYIQRPPMMGLLHLPFSVIFGYNNTGVQKYVALVLHFFALFVFGLMATQLLGKKISILVQTIYAILPCFWGYLFYFLTESVTPSLLVFLFYGYVKFQLNQSTKWLFFQSVFSGILLLTRPQLSIFILPFFYFLGIYIRGRHHRKWIIFLSCLFLAFAGFGLWQVRSMSIAKHWAGMHPIYDVTNNTQYRPVHRSFGELFKIWEHNSQQFHSTMTMYWTNRDAPVEQVSTYNKLSWPNHKILHQNEDLLRTFFGEYYQTSMEIIPYEQQNIAAPGESIREINLRLRVDSLTHQLKKQMWKENYITTPLHSMEFMFSKSQLNLYIFQEKYRGKWWMETTRYFCLSIILLSTFLTISQILNRKDRIWFLFGISVLLYLFYLFFIQKMNEERYLMPLLPLFLLSAFERVISFFKKRPK
jgi:hypothetical protein